MEEVNLARYASNGKTKRMKVMFFFVCPCLFDLGYILLDNYCIRKKLASSGNIFFGVDGINGFGKVERQL